MQSTLEQPLPLSPSRNAFQALRFAGVALLFLVCFLVPVGLFTPPQAVLDAHARATAGTPQLPYLVGFALLSALAVVYPLRRSVVGGWRLVVGLGVSFYGLQTFMGQIETWWFQHAFPLIDDAELGRLFLRGAVTALAFVPLAAWIFGRARARPGELAALTAQLPWRTWAVRIPLLAAGYVSLYLLFGHFVAWQFAEVRQFYSGSTALNGFFAQMAHLVVDEPDFIPFQYLRGLLWVGFSVPVVLLVRDRRAAAIALAILLGLFGAQILLPSAFFPPMVRVAHFIETSTSTALFGALIGWFLPASGRR